MDPLKLEAEFTDEMMDDNLAASEEFAKVSRFLAQVVSRYLGTKDARGNLKGMCAAPALTCIYNASAALDQAIIQIRGAEQPRVQVPGMGMPPMSPRRMN
jgi:hypothetical protein